MNKEKIKKLELYLQKCLNSLTSTIPQKHVNRVAEYKAMLQKEIDTTSKKIEQIKLGV